MRACPLGCLYSSERPMLLGMNPSVSHSRSSVSQSFSPISRPYTMNSSGSSVLYISHRVFRSTVKGPSPYKKLSSDQSAGLTSEW